MRGCNKKKKAKYIVIVFFAIIILGRIFIPWALEPENFRDTKNKINSFINRYTIPDSYNAKSLIAVDLSNNNDFVSKRANEQQTPASLAKLFVIDYATTLVDLDDVVLAKNEAISLTKQGSSVANIKEKKYYVKNLFAAMLVPSGNDAAYVLADYCGGIISPKATTSKERIEVFMKNLNEYLKQNDYKDTILYDPSGFDTEAHTTVLDLKEVVMDLLKNEWFKDIVSQTSYTATLPDGSMQTWKNTNTFLDPTSEYYNKNVIGVKKRARLISYIPQKTGINISMTVREVCLLGFNPHLRIFESYSSNMRQKVDKAIDSVGLAGLYNTDFLTLSEGQKLP